MAEILLHTITSKNSPINVIAVIDDNLNKQQKYLVNKKIVSFKKALDYKHDAILISSYANNEIIFMNLVNIGHDKHKIIKYFDI